MLQTFATLVTGSDPILRADVEGIVEDKDPSTPPSIDEVAASAPAAEARVFSRAFLKNCLAADTFGASSSVGLKH